MVDLGGRPLKYADPDDLEKAINDYFDKCDNTLIKVQHAHSKGITIVETPTPYTMAGLALCLNVDRTWLNSLEDRENDKFLNIITYARKRIEQQNITLAMVGCHDSKIAALNLSSNFNYSNKNESNVKIDGFESVLREIDED